MHQHKHPDRNTNLLWYGLTELMWGTKKQRQSIDKLYMCLQVIKVSKIYCDNHAF